MHVTSKPMRRWKAGKLQGSSGNHAFENMIMQAKFIAALEARRWLNSDRTGAGDFPPSLLPTIWFL